MEHNSQALQRSTAQDSSQVLHAGAEVAQLLAVVWNIKCRQLVAV
jgi:hypothetical protein